MKQTTKEKWTSRKFILMTLLFLMAQVLMWFQKIPPLYWLLASTIGTFGFVVVRAWLQSKSMEKEKE